MSATCLFDQVPNLKNKFKHFFLHKKKMQSLENYSQVAYFPHQDFLFLIKRCMRDGFLGEKEADFLSYMIEKYEINFLDWSHRTNWLKKEMQRLTEHVQAQQSKSSAKQLTLFDYMDVKPKVSSNIPFEILAQQQKFRQMDRRF